MDDVSISFEAGEVHALIGENGAGKSTFIKTLSGCIRPTSGSITFDGKEYDHLEPKQAIDLGIAVVYQELVQFEAMSVADNIFMGVKEMEGVILDDKMRNEKAAEWLKVFDCDFSPSTLIRDLSIANRQIVELAKAMVKKAKVVVMDEPTAAITASEQEKLYTLVKKLKNDGITVIYISHRLEELFVVCDRISVLRDGQYVTTCDIKDLTKQDMIKLMVGRELTNAYPTKKPCDMSQVVLDVQNVSGNGVKNISFQLHKGEILGFAGLVGSGRTELMHVLLGAAKKESGKVLLNGKEVKFRSPADGLKAGIGLIPEDRKFQGCFIDKAIQWNISISAIDSLATVGVVNVAKETKLATEYKDRLKIKTPYLDTKASSLSGGNQQKVVISKALVTLPDILIFDEPTRGIDVGARYEIYLLMNELAEQGKSILMVSSDMEELLGMSERIVVLHEGHKSGELSDKAQYSQETVLMLASSAVEEE